MNNDFLPENYEVPKGASRYMKFEQGDNRFRVLEKPIFGWEGWITEGGKDKPVRFKFTEKPKDFTPYKRSEINHFWAMPVWNYAVGAVQVLQISQSSIQSELKSLAFNEDWGSPLGYNITINRTGEKLATKYSVTPSPHKPLPEDAVQAWEEVKAKGFDITRLFVGGDPFNEDDKTKSEADKQYDGDESVLPDYPTEQAPEEEVIVA